MDCGRGICHSLTAYWSAPQLLWNMMQYKIFISCFILLEKCLMRLRKKLLESHVKDATVHALRVFVACFKGVNLFCTISD